MDLTSLERKVLRTKKYLRDWELIFSKKHGRPATVEDIKERPNIAKWYKQYNQLKKELKEEQEAALFQQSSSESPPESYQTSTTSQSPEKLDNKDSVEFVRSHNSHGHIKPERVLTEEKAFWSRETSSHSQPLPNPGQIKPRGKLTEEEAFWLGETTTNSQPSPSHTSTLALEPTSGSSNSQPRLILGSSKPKKVKNLKKLYGRNPFERAISSQELFDDNSSVNSMPSPLPASQTLTSDMITDDDHDDLDDMEGIEIVNHQVDPFRKYDPSLFRWEDPSFSVGPGFFSNASPCYMVPMLNDPTRRDRVLYKLEKGTLGEVLKENQTMEEELDEDIKQFISTHSRLDPNSFESSVTEIDENLLNSYQYKKKPLQKRQTKLFKMKFVETR